MGMWLRRHIIKLVSFIFVGLSFIFVGLHMCVGVGTSWPTPGAVSYAALDVWVEELPFDLESVFQYDLS